LCVLLISFSLFFHSYAYVLYQHSFLHDALPILRDFHGPKDGNVNGAGTDHRERSRRAEVARARCGSNSFLAGVDQLWVQLLFGRVCAHTENAVLGGQNTFLIRRNESWNLGWDTNREVDVLAVF